MQRSCYPENKVRGRIHESLLGKKFKLGFFKFPTFLNYIFITNLAMVVCQATGFTYAITGNYFCFLIHSPPEPKKIPTKV